jgi:hypothetical protein
LKKVFDALLDSLQHYYSSTTLTRQQEAAEAAFRELADEWESETKFLSSLTARAQHPAYREIIRLGDAVVPVVLRELQRKPNHWFAALRAITGADPVKPNERGDLSAMTRAWLRWARQQNISW